jgi:hypothetical protein
MKGLFRPFGVGLFRKAPWLPIATEREFGASTAIPGAGSGAPGAVTLVAPTGVASNGNGQGSGAPGAVTLNAPTGVGSNGTGQTVFMLVISGQSNAEGRANATNGVDRAGVDSDFANFYQYPSQPGQSDYQILSTDTTPLIHYSGYTRTNSVLGPGEGMAKQMLADNPGAIVVATPTAVGSTGLSGGPGGAAWAGSTTPGAGGSLFENMITQIVADYGKIKLQWPGATIKLVNLFVQGEQDAGNARDFTTYYNALVLMINSAITRLVAAGVSEASAMKYVIGSMIPRLWHPTSANLVPNYVPINRAHVMASVNLPNVLYSKGSPDNEGSNTAAGGDGLHYLPVASTRLQGQRAGLTLSDTVGPTMTSPATYTNRIGHTLNFPLACNDDHATFEIVAGLDSARFSLSDPYITPTINWVGGGNGPPNGSYQVKVRARDGSGNYGAIQTLTFTVAAEVNPVSFYTSGELGAIFDPNDWSNLSQTIDGLTPVTAVGQSVGYVRDPSPNANHWRAAANNNTRPTLQQVGGKYVLRFDRLQSQILFASTPFYTPGVSTVYTAIMGLQMAVPAATQTIFAAQSTVNSTPFFVPLQALNTGELQQSMRNNGSGGGTFPKLPTTAIDGTAKVYTSARSPAGTGRMRDATLRPSDGGAGASYTAVANTSIGVTIDANRMAIGGNCGATPANFLSGDVSAFFVTSGYLSDDQVQFGEEWAANRTPLASALPGSSPALDGNGAGGTGSITLTAPAGVGTGGSGSASGSGAPGGITLSAPAGTGSGSSTQSGSGSGGPGGVTLVAPTGVASFILNGHGQGGTNVINLFPPTGTASYEIDVSTPEWRITHAPKRAA